MDKNKHQYQTSAFGHKCITPCYEKGSRVTHPLTLQVVTNNVFPFCAIVPIKEQGKMEVTSLCKLEQSMNTPENVTQSKNKLDLLYPIVEFNQETFLRDYYEIIDVGDLYRWLRNNKMAPVYTRMRIIEISSMVFWDTITVVEDIFPETIIDIIKKFWIKLLYGKLCIYIGVKNDTGFIINSNDNKLKKTDDVQIRTNFLFSKLITREIVTEICNNYFLYLQHSKTLEVKSIYYFILETFEEKLIAVTK